MVKPVLGSENEGVSIKYLAAGRISNIGEAVVEHATSRGGRIGARACLCSAASIDMHHNDAVNWGLFHPVLVPELPRN